MNSQYLHQLEAVRTSTRREMRALIDRAEAEGRTSLNASESKAFRDLQAADTDLKDQIANARRNAKVTASVSRFGNAESTDALTRRWADRATEQLRRSHTEQRAVVSGSLDLPVLVEPQVVDIPHPTRITDLLVNRQAVESNAFTFYQQTARNNAATAVADLATKPTSTLTVKAVEDRCRVIAHLSEAVPLRIWDDHQEFASWLQAEMVAGVLDGLEEQVIAGLGTGEDMRGLYLTPGVNSVPFDTDINTTLRSAVTKLQTLGETPTAWVLHPNDAQKVDLTRWSTGGGFLTGGFQYDGGQPTSANIFGGPVTRVVSPSVQEGLAILGDFTKIKLYVRQETRFDIDVSGPELFDKNAFKARCEIRVGLGVLRPQAFAIVDLNGTQAATTQSAKKP